MAKIIAFPTSHAAPAKSTPSNFDRAAYRTNLETAVGFLLDQTDKLIALLDRLDADPDFEPGADEEENGDNEPELAALVSAISQTKWVGFDQGGAA